MSSFKMLAVETSCDESAAAVVGADASGRIRLLSNIVSSQVELHARWGGVVPNLAAREHLKNLPLVIEQALQESALRPKDIDALAVTQGPGLIPALLVGTEFAKTLAYCWHKPLLGIHHIEGHIYANLIGSQKSSKIKFPALCLVVSGGHTQLVLMRDHFRYEIIGQTLDDAAGEAFDKVARILDIGYPGGPAVSAKAETANCKSEAPGGKITLPRPMLNKKGYDFSFSGLKTAVLYETKKLKEQLSAADYEKLIPEICREFQQAAIDVLVAKTIQAAEKHDPKTIMLAGGVSANKELRRQLGEAISVSMPDTCYLVPDTTLTGDNAAMIATAAALRWSKMTAHEKQIALDGWQNVRPDANLKLK